MSAEKTEALVIRMADWSESSRVVTFFTRDFGQIATVAKGAKRLKGPFEIALDLLTVSQIVFLRKSSSGLDILTECQLVSRFKPKGKDLESLYAGYYVAELLSGSDRTLRPTSRPLSRSHFHFESPRRGGFSPAPSPAI